MRAAKGLTIALLLLGAAGVLVLQTLTWYTVQLAAGTSLTVTGGSVVPLASTLALALLALGAALMLSAGVLRGIVAGVGVVLSVGMLVVLWNSTVAGTGNLYSSLAASTGISGAALSAEIISIQRSPAGTIALVLGTAVTAVSLWTLATQHRWRAAARRFEREPTVDSSDAASNWDSLSRGEDPTESR